MDAHDKRVIHSSKESNWGTPQALFDALDREFGFALDAAANRHNRKVTLYCGPDRQIATLRDGLTADWRRLIGGRIKRGTPAVFINPPYSRQSYRESVERGTPDRAMLIEAWAEKCAKEAQNGLIVVGVFPAATQTEWWATWVRSGPLRAHEIRSLPHRVTFVPPGHTGATRLNNAGGNTAIVIWRPRCYVGAWQPAERVWTYRPPARLSTRGESSESRESSEHAPAIIGYVATVHFGRGRRASRPSPAKTKGRR